MENISVTAIMTSGNLYEVTFKTVDMEYLQKDFQEKINESGGSFAFGKHLLQTRHIEAFKFKYLL